MKLTLETAENCFKPGDKVMVDYGGNVKLKCTIEKIDILNGMVLKREDGRIRVHGPAIFRSGLNITTL